MTEHDQESKNKRIAALSTAAIQVLVVFLLFIIVAWRAPNPPLPEYGIELNFGMDTEGSGDIQPETPVGNEGNQPEKAAQEEQTQPEPEVKQEEVREEVKPTETKQVEEQPVSKVESPVVVKEKEKKPEPQKEEPKKIEEKKVEKQPEVVKPKADPNATYKPSNEQATAEKEANKEGAPGNHGDDKNKTGDKGNPEGKLDAKALYGNKGGGGGGPAVSGFDGFEVPTIPTPALPDEAFGTYEFIVRIDDQGQVIKVTPGVRGLSIEAQKRFQEVIRRLEFIPKGSNLPPESEGKITFKVLSK